MRRALLLATSLIAVGAGVIFVGARVFVAPGPAQSAVVFVVPRGGIGAVAAALAAKRIIAHQRFFAAAAWLTSAEGPLRAGELEFPPAASMRTVLSILRSGRAVQHRLTIAEGLTAAQISQVFARADGLTGDVAVPPEGTLLPDTYVFERDTSRVAVAAGAAAAMRRVLSAEWAERADGLPLHTQDDALILASIVEREAKLPAERPMIARVFLNRLAIGMRLQADPTAAYAAAGGLGRLDRALEHADIQASGPYNTYAVVGLPAGPICNPGIASIKAVLHPASGNAVYFVADGNGGHLFTDKLSVHDANVAHLRKVRL